MGNIVDALGPTRCPQSATSVHDLNFSSATPKLTRFPPTEIMESRTLPFRPPGPNDADGELSPDSSAMTRLTPDSDSNSGSDSENDSDLDLDMGEVGESFKMQRRGRDVEKGGVGDKEGLNDQDDEEDDYTTTGRRRAASISTVQSYQLYTPDEERAVVRKFDRKLVLFVALLYMLSFLDRSNIGNAKIAGLDLDLDLDSPRYEWVITAFLHRIYLLRMDECAVENSAGTYLRYGHCSQLGNCCLTAICCDVFCRTIGAEDAFGDWRGWVHGYY